MPRTIIEDREVQVPEDIAVRLENKVLTVKGPLGELTRDFSAAPVEITITQGKISVKSYWANKRKRALVGTTATHIRNMLKGVQKGYVYQLKVISSHFPITVKVQQGRVLIENFIGERSPRIAEIKGDVKVSVKGGEVEVQGVNLQDVSQTAANIERATKIKQKDSRVFLDGIYVYNTT